MGHPGAWPGWKKQNQRVGHPPSPPKRESILTPNSPTYKDGAPNDVVTWGEDKRVGHPPLEVLGLA